MKSLAHKQITTHPSSHDEDGACEGGRNGYPSDHQAALNKLHVGLSDNRDRAEETLGSETSGPVSGRTRLKKRSEASRLSGRNGDDSAGPSDGDATGVDDIALVLQQNRLRWYGHVLRKDDDD